MIERVMVCRVDKVLVHYRVYLRARQRSQAREDHLHLPCLPQLSDDEFTFISYISPIAKNPNNPKNAIRNLGFQSYVSSSLSWRFS